jgi:hypothetical protein
MYIGSEFRLTFSSKTFVETQTMRFPDEESLLVWFKKIDKEGRVISVTRFVNYQSTEDIPLDRIRKAGTDEES